MLGQEVFWKKLGQYYNAETERKKYNERKNGVVIGQINGVCQKIRILKGLKRIKKQKIVDSKYNWNPQSPNFILGLEENMPNFGHCP
jgi:hypothetical protein